MPILLALALFAVVALASREVQGSLEMLAGAAAWALLFWAMADLRAPAHRGAIAMGVVGGVAAWMAIFAIRWGTEKVEWVANGGGLPNLFESIQTLFWLTSNVVPVLPLLALGFAFHLPRSPASRLVVALLMVASAIAVPMSGGRAGWLGLLVAALAAVVLFRPQALRLPRVAWGAIAAGILVVGVVAAVVLGDRLLDVTGLSSRLPLWGQALSIAAVDPLTGGGPGTYSWLRLEHVEPYHSPVPAFLAHNVVLQTLADGGLLLAVALGAMVGGVAIVAWRRRGALGPAERGTLAVLMGFIPSTLLDDHSSLPAVTAMVVTLAAWLVVPATAQAQPAAAPTGRPSLARLRRPAMLAAMAVAFALSLPSTVAADVARLHAGAGRAAMLTGEFGLAANAFERAIAAYPARANYHLSAGMALALAGQTDAARERYRRASELSPADARAWGALAALAETPADALRFARRAAQSPTRDPRYAYALGESLASTGHPSALDAFAHAVARTSETLVAIERGIGLDVAAEVSRTVLSRVGELSAEAQVEPEHLSADLGLARGEAVSDLPPAWDAIRRLQQNDLVGATAAVERASELAPFATTTWRAAEAVAHERCDDSAAEAARSLLALVPGGRVRNSVALVYRTTDVVYRETGLGSYQPAPPPYDPELLVWPAAYLPQAPRCSP